MTPWPSENDVTEVTDPPEEVPVAGGTLRYGIEADVDGLNPTTSSWSPPGYVMGNAVFDALTRWNENGEAVPYLAESVTPVTEGDFTKWQIKLRPGISFHDGTPLNSAALQANFEAQLGSPVVGLAVKPFFPATGATEIIDDLTIQYNLLDANAFFAATLTSQLGYVASPTWLAAAIADPVLNQQPVGTGPFVYDSRTADSVTRFVRNPNWWNGEVLLDAAEFVPVPDPDTRTSCSSPANCRRSRPTTKRRTSISPRRRGCRTSSTTPARSNSTCSTRRSRRSTTSAPVRRWPCRSHERTTTS